MIHIFVARRKLAVGMMILYFHGYIAPVGNLAVADKSAPEMLHFVSYLYSKYWRLSGIETYNMQDKKKLEKYIKSGI